MSRQYIIASIFLILFFLLSSNYIVNSEDVIYNNITLEYYSRNVIFYNISSESGFNINRFSSFATIKIRINNNSVEVTFEPVPINVFRNYTLHVLKEVLKFNKTILNKTKTNPIYDPTYELYKNYLENESFVRQQYNYYLNNFTINIRSFVIKYTLNDYGYAIGEPRMGLFPFYTPYVIDFDTIEKYRPIYLGCPITEDNLGYTYIEIPDNLISKIDKRNLEYDNLLRLVSISINCRNDLLKQIIQTDLNYRGNYLFSSIRVILIYGDYAIFMSGVEPSPDTFVFLANIPVDYGPGDTDVAILAGVVVAIVGGGVGYYFVRRRRR